jgi:trimethylamine--corrinoid protein Co-methyltransferase
MLSESQCEEIYFSALQILERTGIEVFAPEIRDFLKEKGVIFQGQRAYFSASIVQQALETAPKAFNIYGRCGGKSDAIPIRPNYINYGTGSGCINFMDPRSGERRGFTREDAGTTARVADALQNIDFVQPLGSAPAPPEMTDIYEFVELITHTTKPLLVYSRTLEITRTMHQIATVVAGGENEFAMRPNYIVSGSPGSPLFLDVEPTRRLIYCAEHKIPYVSSSAVTMGATAPATIAGALVQVIAEELSEVVLTQLANPGAPVFLGGVHSIMDMKSGILAYGAPEMNMILAAQTQIARYLGLPFFSTAGCSDSKIVDQQAAIEGALSIMVAGLSGANIIHDVGYIEYGSTGSLQQLVLMDEVIGMVKHLLGGVDVTEKSMAMEVIERVGPGGQYLSDKHTLEHFQSGFFFPTLMDRNSWDEWSQKGGKTCGERVQDKLNHILDNHEIDPLPTEVREEIDAILVRAEERT